MPVGGCILGGQYPLVAAKTVAGAGQGGYSGTCTFIGLGRSSGVVAKPLAGAGNGLYSGACKFLGFHSVAGKGIGLGLGLGLGAFGPLLLVGAGIAGGYLFFKGKKYLQKSSVKEGAAK